MDNQSKSHTPPQNIQHLIFPYALVFYEVVVYLSNDMYLPSLPNIAQDLNASQDVTQYTLSLWFLGTCMFQLVLTPISEKYGKRAVIFAGCGLFLVSNLMCALAPTMGILLVARFLQGSIVSTVTVVGYAMIHELYSSKKTVKVLSIMASVMLLAPAAGPIVGAFVLKAFSWRFIFYLITALGVLGAVGLYLFMPTDHVRTPTSFKKALHDYKRLCCTPNFMRYGLGLSIIISTFFIWIVEAPFVVVSGLKHTPDVFGWAQVFVFGAIGIGSQMAKFLVDRLHVSQLIRMAVILIIVGMASFLVASYTTDNLYLIVGAMMLYGIGASQTFGSLNRLAVESSTVAMVNSGRHPSSEALRRLRSADHLPGSRIGDAALPTAIHPRCLTLARSGHLDRCATRGTRRWRRKRRSGGRDQ